MPLLHKRLFEPCPVPAGIGPDTPVFYCKHTREVFLSHEEYFKRIVLLNSTMWSCALTRKTNLTYFEAVQSEESAERELCDFPVNLETPILFIVQNLTNRGRFEDLVNDIYSIMRDRYFNNEEVTFSEKSRKFTARIIASYNDSAPFQLEAGVEYKEPVMPLADEYTYSIELLDGNVPLDGRVRHHIGFDRLFRSKNVGSRQKVRLFLKNACRMTPAGDRYTVKDEHLMSLEHMTFSDLLAGPAPICCNTPVQQRGRIPNMMKPGYVEPEKKERKVRKEEKDPNTPSRPRGRPPKTPEQKALTQAEKKIRKRKEAVRMTDECDLTSSGALTLSVPSTSTPPKKRIRHNSEKKKAKILEQQEDLDFYFSEARRLGIDVAGLEKADKLLSVKVVADFKQKVKDEKDAERENLKEEKKRKNREKAAYNKKREDLICNDLKPMPRFPKLELPRWMSDEEFGDFIFILQFFTAFKDVLPLEEIRGSEEITFNDIILAIKCNDPQNSPFADLMRVLLSIRTDIADEEDGDEADYNNREEVYLINTQNCDPANPTHGDSIRDSSDLHFKIRKTHGKSVRHLPVDWMTLTEVLRLIFETSGYYTGIATHRHRLYARGNFRGYEDPAFEFKNLFPEIMEKLRTQTVFDLEPSERLEITKTLIFQLLTYSKFRGQIEKQQNEMFEFRKEQKKLKNWDTVQEAEANAARLLLEMGPSNGTNGVSQDMTLVKKLKTYIKAHNEGRRYDKDDLDKILLDVVPYASLDLDEIVTARELQKTEYKQIMESLVDKIFQLYCTVSDIRLGQDRAYRRYVIVQNLSLLLVESLSASEPLIECEEQSAIDNAKNLEENEQEEVFICSGKLSTCTVHGEERSKRTRWCYVESRTQLETLIASLNPRGNRENELIEELNEYKGNLMDMLNEVEKAKQDGAWKTILMTDDSDPADTYNIDWHTEMCDLLLDFEEKIDQGQLGSIEKKFSVNRAEWRDQLKSSGDVCGLLRENIQIYNDVLVDVEEVSTYSEVKKLAAAFLMIVRSISFKFIKPPFLSPNRDEHGNFKASEMYVRWQRALLQCESLSALSLFISTVESSIKWNESRLQGKCRSCRRKGVAHELVLCAECDKCYHLKCAKLETDKEAPSDWLCSTCRAQQRKEENEAKRMNRVDREEGGDEEEMVNINNMSINEDSESPKQAESSSSTSIQAQVETIRTSSGRSVKKVHYSSVHEGISLKSRKSNGSVPAPSSSDRPVRAASLRIFEINEENGAYSDDSNPSDGENSTRRKSVKKAPSKTVSPPNVKEKMTAIEALLKETMRQECSWPFLQPVDSKEVPDYYDVIKRPMDLRTMMNKIKQRVYNKPEEVRNDFQLILKNCETYNETDSEIFQLSQQLNNFAASRLDTIVNQ